METKDLVSVIIPTFGRSEFLIRALKSVLNQTFKDIEIIIVDDNGKGSKNQILTEDRIKDFFSTLNNIKYIVHDINKNGSAARNTGIAHASGQFICFLDDDDEFLPEKLSSQISLLRSLDKEWVACYTGHTRLTNGVVRAEYNPKFSGDILYELLTHSIDTCSGSTLMIKIDIISKVKGFDVELKRHQDYDFIAKVAYYGKIAVIPEALVIIHEHGGNYKQKLYADVIFTRKQYMSKIEPFLSKLDRDQRRKVRYVNHLELCKQALKYRKIKDAFIYYLNCKAPFKALVDLTLDSIIYFRKSRTVYT